MAFRDICKQSITFNVPKIGCSGVTGGSLVYGPVEARWLETVMTHTARGVCTGTLCTHTVTA